MIQRPYTLTDINQKALNVQLEAALGTVYGGYATSGGPGNYTVTVNMQDSATQPEINQLDSLMAAHDPLVLTGEQQARADLKTVAQSAVGVSYTSLTTAQLRALLAALIMESGGIADDLTIKPLGQWLR